MHGEGFFPMVQSSPCFLFLSLTRLAGQGQGSFLSEVVSPDSSTEHRHVMYSNVPNVLHSYSLEVTTSQSLNLKNY